MEGVKISHKDIGQHFLQRWKLRFPLVQQIQHMIPEQLTTEKTCQPTAGDINNTKLKI